MVSAKSMGQWAGGGQQQGGGQDGGGAESQTSKQLDEYTGAYSKYILSNKSPEEKATIKRTLDQLETGLKKQGITPEDLHSVGVIVKQAARKEISKLIKDAFLQRLTTTQKSVEWAVNEKNVNNMVDFAFLNESLGGFEFGGTNLQQITDSMRTEAEEILRSVVLNEFEKDLSKNASTHGDGVHKDDVAKFVELAERIGVDVKAWTKSWEDRKWDLGLVELSQKMLNKIKDDQEQNSSMSQDQKKKKKEEKIEEIEDADVEESRKNLLLDQLRGVHTERYLNFTWATFMKTAFKFREVKGKLRKYGVTDKDMNEVKQQALGLARVKLIGLIKEAYMERVLILDESRARVKLVSRRLTKMEAKLNELGVTLGKEDVDKIKNDIEHNVYESSVIKYMGLREKVRQLGSDNNTEKEMLYLKKLIARFEKRITRENRMKEIANRNGKYVSSMVAHALNEIGDCDINV